MLERITPGPNRFDLTIRLEFNTDSPGFLAGLYAEVTIGRVRQVHPGAMTSFGGHAGPQASAMSNTIASPRCAGSPGVVESAGVARTKGS